MKEIDYVELYARELKKNPALFRQQKMLIESQYNASRSLFRNMFQGEDYNQKAREYLRGIGLLK
ncbi:MAG TPA: hypothetical protein VJG49_03390 [Candidatus Nanoarchaeia archaeon]|nr:hypothetical protein [Candidatus Nanoarchaeia archaeon]